MVLSATAWFIMGTLLTQDAPPVELIILMMVFQGVGTGLFNSPNNSSILSAVERSSYGVIASLTQLVRNSANVTSVAIATTIVVMVMGFQGAEPSLDAVSPMVAGAFVAGMRWAFIFMGSALAIAAVLSFIRGERAAPPTAETNASPETPTRKVGN